VSILGDAIDVALRVADALESVGATYFVGGSLASSLDGQPRATTDIDFVIDMPIGKIGDFVGALGAEFEVDRDMVRDAVMHGRSANIFYLPLVLKIDLFGHAHGPFDDSEFSRRRAIEVREGRILFVKSPEDTILRKMLWFRQGGEGIVARSPNRRPKVAFTSTSAPRGRTLHQPTSRPWARSRWL
jgi:hypothetical protein